MKALWTFLKTLIVFLLNTIGLIFSLILKIVKEVFDFISKLNTEYSKK